jgi:DNA-binding beta-propeller fold protein YncE
MVIELFGDTPRALAASPDGDAVYAAVFQSGNETTTVTESAVCDGGDAADPCGVDGVQVPGGLSAAQVPGGLPAPNMNSEGTPGPEVGLIVKHNPSSGLWEDQLGRNWTNAVRFNLPDHDVFRIDALANPPAESAAFAHVGTVLFNMLVNPSDDALYVSNTDARNDVRFEGPGTSASTVRGHLHEARITVIDGADVLPRHLNKHIEALPQSYRTTPMPAGVKEASLATPLGMVLASDGTLYVAAFRLERGGGVRCRRAGGRHLRPRCRASHCRQRRRSLGVGPRRGAPSPLRADPLRQRREGDRHRDRRRDRPAPAAQPGAAGGGRGAAVPLRRTRRVEQRRGGVRQRP